VKKSWEKDVFKVPWCKSIAYTHVQGGATDSPTFVMVTECRHGHQSGRTIAHSKAENVEFFAITI
jgi:hypothetical protein